MENVWVPGVVSVGPILLLGWAPTDGRSLSETEDLVWSGSGRPRNSSPPWVRWICWILESWMDLQRAAPERTAYSLDPSRVPRLSSNANIKLGSGGRGWRVHASGPPQAQGVIRGLRVRIAWTANAMEITAGSRVTRTESRRPSRNETTARSS